MPCTFLMPFPVPAVALLLNDLFDAHEVTLYILACYDRRCHPDTDNKKHGVALTHEWLAGVCVGGRRFFSGNVLDCPITEVPRRLLILVGTDNTNESCTCTQGSFGVAKGVASCSPPPLVRYGTRLFGGRESWKKKFKSASFVNMGASALVLV